MAVKKTVLTGRPKGSRDRAPRDKVTVAMRRLFSKKLVAAVQQLSKDSGVRIIDVCEDMGWEGLTVCREDMYRSLIKMRQNRGMIVRENDDERTDNDTGAMDQTPEREETGRLGTEPPSGRTDPANDAAASVFFDAIRTPAAISTSSPPTPAGSNDADERPGQQSADTADPERVVAGKRLMQTAEDEGVDTSLPL